MKVGRPQVGMILPASPVPARLPPGHLNRKPEAIAYRSPVHLAPRVAATAPV